MEMNNKRIRNSTCIYPIYAYRVLEPLEIEIGNGGFMREKEVEAGCEEKKWSGIKVCKSWSFWCAGPVGVNAEWKDGFY